jgi:Holliday junction resolvase RusA-like endonuclease
MQKLLYEISIADFPTEIQISNKQRARYFKEGRKTPKMPKKYQTSDYQFNKKGILVDKVGTPMIANPNVVGKPRIMKINGQGLYNAQITKFTRAKVMAYLKDFFRIHVQKIPEFHDFPLIMEGEVFRPYTNARGGAWDVDNFSVFYIKAFQDALTEGGIIPDDNRRFISKPLSFLYTPGDDRYRMIIRFYHDSRAVWDDYPIKNE